MVIVVNQEINYEELILHVLREGIPETADHTWNLGLSFYDLESQVNRKVYNGVPDSDRPALTRIILQALSNLIQTGEVVAAKSGERRTDIALIRLNNEPTENEREEAYDCVLELLRDKEVDQDDDAYSIWCPFFIPEEEYSYLIQLVNDAEIFSKTITDCEWEYDDSYICYTFT